jgi:PBSX family phage terminase large subunit
MAQEADQRQITFTPHRHQQEVLDSSHEQILVVAGHRSGKTTVGAIWLIREIANDIKNGVKADYLVLGPTYRVLNQSTLRTLFGYWPKGLGSYKKQDSIIQLVNGGVVWIRSADKPDAVEGLTARRCWMDEAALCNETTYDKVCQRLVQKAGEPKGRLLMTTTPYGSPASWMNLRLIELRNQLKWLFYINFSMADNPYIDRAVYDRAKATMNESVFQRDFEGRFVKIEGLIYPEFSRLDHVVEPFDLPAHWPRWSGLDYGWTDPTSILGITYDPEGKKFFIYRQFYKNRQLAQVIGNWLKSENFTYTIYDPAAVAVMNEVRTVCKLRLDPADNNVDVGIQRITKLLKENRIQFFDTCEDLIREIEGYCYEKQPPNGRTPKPGHECSHSPDALRYGFSRSLAGVYDLVRVGGVARKRSYSGFDPLDLHKRPQSVAKALRETNELLPYKSFTNLDNEGE